MNETVPHTAHQPVVEPHTPQQRELLQKTIEAAFLKGCCYELSQAWNELTDYPIYGLFDKDGLIVHSAVRTPEGEYIDARGTISEKELKQGFGLIESIREVTIEDLEHTRAASGLSISQEYVDWAKKLLLVLEPSLSPESEGERIKRFLFELQELSRSHGIFIGGGSPGSSAHITVVPKGELAPMYVAAPTDNVVGYTLNTQYLSEK